MSVFVLTDYEFSQIVKFCTIHKFYSPEGIREENGMISYRAIGDILKQENVKSVNYLHRENNVLPFNYEDIPQKDILTPVQLFGLLDCLEYQSCEHPGFKDSQAFAIINRLRKLAGTLLDGYSWGGGV